MGRQKGGFQRRGRTFCRIGRSFPSLVCRMVLELVAATEGDVAGVFALKRAVAEHLTERYGKGPWSPFGTIKGTASAVRSPTLWLLKEGEAVIAMLRLASRKPWAIDPS